MSSVTLPRPTERIAIFSFLLVFLCGAVAGAIGMSMVKNTGMHGAPPVSSGFSMFSVTEMKSQLNLTDDQSRQLISILDDFSHYYDNVLADGSSRIRQILDPGQQKRFDRLLQQHRK